MGGGTRARGLAEFIVGLLRETMQYNTFSTETWRVNLPIDWMKKDSSRNGQLYFESADGTMGFYIATWKFKPEDHGGSNLQAVKDVAAAERKGFENMEESEWTILLDDVNNSETQAISVLDYYDTEKNYRIVCKSIASLPYVVRSSFHDFLCNDLSNSQILSEEILGSFEINT